MKKNNQILAALVIALACLPVAILLCALVPGDHAPTMASEPRSPQWPKVRAAHLKKEPCCVACGKSDELNVHHIEPFHVKPEKELDPNNLITLCPRCHLLFGHLDNWKSWNVDVRKDAEAMRRKITRRPKQ